MFKTNARRLFVMVAVLLLISACASPNSGKKDLSFASKSSSQKASARGDDLKIVAQLPTPVDTNNGEDILISENDLLAISVFQVDDLNKEVRVQSNGKISLPLIGAVRAAGMTVPALEADIEQRYGSNYLQNPEVSVFMKESAGQRITLEGEFKKPGIYQNESKTTLLKATALGGGLSELADERKIYVFRNIRSQTYVAQISLKDVREGKKPDPRIHGGDVIIAFQSGAKVASKNLRETLGLAVSATSLVRPF